MSNLKDFRSVLRSFCTASAVVGLVGITASGTLAGQEASSLPLDETLEPKRSAVESLDNLKRLVILQRRQIGSQQIALGATTKSNDAAQLGLEFLVPSDEDALRDMVATQQQWIERQESQLAERQANAAAATKADGRAPAVMISSDTASRRDDDTPVLPRRIDAQDNSARALFDQALLSSKDKIVPETVVESPTVKSEPALNRSVVMVESGLRLQEAPTLTPVVWLSADTPRVEPVIHAIAEDVHHEIQTSGAQIVAAVETDVNDADQTHAVDQAQLEQLTEIAKAYGGSKTVPDEELDEIRAGFVTPSGLIVNVGIIFETLVNGELVAQNFIDFDNPNLDFLNDGSLTTVIEGVNGGMTQITNVVGGGAGVSTVITNTANDVVIEQINTVIIDIPNYTEVFDMVGGGNDFVRGIDLPQSFIDMSVGVIQQ